MQTVQNHPQPIAAALQAAVESTRQTAQKPQSFVQPLQEVTPLKQDTRGKQELAAMLYQCFQGLKVWGKEPESLEGAVRLFELALADYPMDVIRKAFSVYLKRSNEMPGTGDIVGIIKRKGRMPLAKEVYVTISKKDVEYRTADEQEYMREYLSSYMEAGWDGVEDEQAEASRQAENNRLRKENMELRWEVKRLNDALHAERRRNGLEKPKPGLQEKISATVEAMRKAGAPEADIEAFLKADGVAE